MKRILLAVTLAAAAFGSLAAETKVEKLADGIWRVRMARDGKWPESGLNRYKIFRDLGAPRPAAPADLAPVRPAAKQAGAGFEIKFPLRPGTRVYGLGDCSREKLQRRPGVYEQNVVNFSSYLPIPFFFTSENWGVLVNSTWLHTIDVGTADPNAVTVTAQEGEVDFYVFVARDYRALLKAYTALTGTTSMLPIGAYGLTFVAHQFVDQFEVINETMKFREYRLPCDFLGLEPGWMSRHYDATTRKEWDHDKFYFPYWRPCGELTMPGAMLRVGMKLSLWLCGGYDLFRYEEQLLAGTAKPIGPDFTPPEGIEDGFLDDNLTEGKEIDECDRRRWYAKTDFLRRKRFKVNPEKFKEGDLPWFEHLKRFVDQGARAFKLDGAGQLGPYRADRVWSNGMKEREAHNLYPMVYAKQLSTGFSGYTGKRAMVYSPSGGAGVQQYVATWAGDTGGGAKSLVSVLNLGLSGHANQSCDMAVTTTNLIRRARGMHFGFLSPWSQINNWDYFFMPWVDEPERVAEFRAYDELRYRLAPYTYAAAAEAYRTGWPIARALSLVYPDERKYDDAKTTYLFGDSLLVGVFGDAVEIPEGTWYEWRTDAPVTGPKTLPYEVTSAWGGALYAKAGAIIPTWPVRQHLDRGWNEEIVLEVWPTADGEAELYEDDGDTLAYRTGACARTKLTLKGRTLTIGARVGAYAGMPATRRFTARVHGLGPVRTVAIGDVGAAGKTVEL